MKYFLTTLTGLVLSANAGLAAVDTTTMAVSATVERSCEVEADPLAFDVLNANAVTNAEAAITITCTAGSANDRPTVTFGLSSNASGPQRRMLGGETGTYVPYNLYSDLGRTALVSGTTPVSTTAGAGGVTYSTTIYGQVPASGSYQLGDYSDSVTVVVDYNSTAVPPAN